MPHPPNTVPDYVRLSRHEWDLDDDGHEVIEHAVAVETDTSLVLAPDGVGGVEFRAETGGGSSSLPWFDVTDVAYGATGNGSTDDTAAVQAAIDACMAAGGGTVFFPPGIYQISGALQNTSTHNSQLVIPTNAFGGSSKAIRFLGMGPNRIYGGTPPGGGESIIRSDWNGSISGHPAIISAGSWRVLRESFVFLSVEDLTIIAHDDPKLSAINMTAGSATRMNRVQIRTTSSDPAAVPTNTNAVAYEGPWGYGSIADEDFWNVAITGFYIGMRPAEQTAGGTIAFAYCAKAMEFVGGTGSGIYTFWPNYFTKITVVACPRGLVFVDDVRWVNIGLYGVELDAAPFGSVYDIDDASNYARGSISYNAVDAVTGPAMRALLVNGGTGLSLHSAQEKYWKLNNVVDIPIGTNPSTNPANGRRLYTDSATGHLSARTSAGATIDYESGAVSYATPAIVLGTAAAAGAASTVIRSDSTIVAFDATVPVTQAFGDSAATGSAAIAARRDHKHGMPSTSATGAILIADTHSTPLVFADLLQTEAQDDLLYAD